MRMLKFPVFSLLSVFLMIQPVSAEVIIHFSNSNVSAVPFSPWLVMAMAVMVVLTGLFFIRKKSGFGLFFYLIMAGVLVSAVSYNTSSFAKVYNIFALITSGQEVPSTNDNEVGYMSPGPTCGPVGFVWVTSGVGNITITGIDYAIGYEVLDPLNPPIQTSPRPLPESPAPECVVGQQLNSSTSCVVWYQKPGGC